MSVLGTKNILRAISVLTLGNKVVLYCLDLKRRVKTNAGQREEEGSRPRVRCIERLSPQTKDDMYQR